MSHKVDYIGEIKIQLQKNLEEVRNDVLNETSQMKEKIDNYCDKYSLPRTFVKHKILTDNLFANQFAKDPSKQTKHQTLAANYIQSIEGIENFEVLPAGGKNALYVIDGILGTESEVEKGESKSIDFHWKYKGFDFYAAHKYTEIDGGAQDNQFNDLMLFLKNASKSNDTDKKYLAIGDGNYYQKKYTKVKNDFSSKIEYMNSQCKTDNSRAITTDDLEKYLNELKEDQK